MYVCVYVCTYACMFLSIHLFRPKKITEILLIKTFFFFHFRVPFLFLRWSMYFMKLFPVSEITELNGKPYLIALQYSRVEAVWSFS